MKKHIPYLFCCAAAVTAVFAFLSETAVRAQIGGIPLWTNFFGPAGAMDLAVDTSGNLFVTGVAGFTGEDFVTIKYSAVGAPLWTNRFRASANGADGTLSIAVDTNGNAFVAGSTAAGGRVTIKYSGTGVPLWTNRLGGNASGGVVVDNSGKVIVAGSTDSPGDFLTVAYSNAGVPLWTNRYNGPENLHDHVRDVAVDANGNVAVTGLSTGSFATIKYSGAGVPLWTNRYSDGLPTAIEIPNAVVVDATGNVFVTGRSDLGCTTIKYSGAGVPLWTNIFHTSGFGAGEALALDNSGNIYVAGSATNSLNRSNDFLTVKYSTAGLPLWTNRYNGPENMYDVARSIAVDPSGNIFVLGDSAYFYAAGDDFPLSFTTLSYSSAGAPLWTNRFTMPSGTSLAKRLVIDGSGNVFVLGRAAVAPSSSQIFVAIKYSSVLPRLAINRTATNTVVVSWPSPSTGFTLQQNTSLNPASNWSNISAGIQDNSNTKTLVVTPASGNRFYRLHKP
jgi:hypothetical protein